MTYEKQRPIISVEQLRQYLNSNLHNASGEPPQDVISAFELQFVAAILFWKSDDWAYEQEARLVTGSNETAIPFPAQELASIILGPRCPTSDEDRVKAMISKRKPLLTVARSKLSRTNYSVEIDW